MTKPSQKYGTKVIALIVTKPMTVQMTDHTTGKVETITFEPSTFEVIGETETAYVCDQWHKPGVPQLIGKSEVDTITRLFDSYDDLESYAKKHGIGRQDKFRFIVKSEPNTIFNSIFEFIHEG